MLLGYPELGPRGFEADPSFHDKDQDRRVYMSEFLLADPSRERDDALLEFKRDALLGHHPQIHYRVIPPSADESRRHAQLTLHYEPQQTLPSEVLVATPRRRPTARPSGSLREDWHQAEAHPLSRFVERNNYPASCRFLAFDLRPQSHVEFDLEEMRFALSVLTLAVNDLPASGLQAERLYRLNVALDVPELAHLLNEHLGVLVETRQHIDGLLRVHDPRPTPTPAEVLPKVEVTVDFDRINGDQLQVALDGYGLVADRPAPGEELWSERINELRRLGGQFAREPGRALHQSVLNARERQVAPSRPAIPLTEIDVEELERELADRSNGLVRQASRDIVDVNKLKGLIDRNDTAISRLLSERMKSGSAAMAFAVVAGAWAVALVPYLIASLFDGASNFAESILVTLIAMSAIGLTGLATLVVMRRQLITRIQAFNQELRSFVSGVTAGAARYGDFLSGLVTYSSGRQRLAAERRRVAASQSERRQLRRLRDRIEERILAEKSIVRSIDRPLHIEHGSHVVSDIEAFGLSQVNKALLWEPGRTQCQFNKSGDTIRAPYPFVTGLTVEDLVIHEPTTASETQRYQDESVRADDPTRAAEES